LRWAARSLYSFSSEYPIRSGRAAPTITWK
jgi:hypothetical protein